MLLFENFFFFLVKDNFTATFSIILELIILEKNESTVCDQIDQIDQIDLKCKTDILLVKSIINCSNANSCSKELFFYQTFLFFSQNGKIGFQKWHIASVSLFNGKHSKDLKNYKKLYFIIFSKISSNRTFSPNTNSKEKRLIKTEKMPRPPFEL